MSTSPVTVHRHDAADGAWEMAGRAPGALLAPHVRHYGGYVERTVAPLRRREVPHGAIVMILSFGDPIDVTTLRGSAPRPRRLRSFVAGLHDAAVVTEHAGRQHGMQVNLTPLGAYRLLGVPLHEVANEVVALDDLRGRAVERLVDCLAAATSWERRFEILDRVLGEWVVDGPEPDRAVAWAWNQLAGSHGQVAVGDLATEIGWSRRHFASRFREQIGLAPKPTGRVLRFDHAVGLLAGDGEGIRTIADVAAMAGYADHSHLVREFQALAGCTPSQLVAAQMPGGGGVAAIEG